MFYEQANVKRQKSEAEVTVFAEVTAAKRVTRSALTASKNEEGKIKKGFLWSVSESLRKSLSILRTLDRSARDVRVRLDRLPRADPANTLFPRFLADNPRILRQIDSLFSRIALRHLAALPSMSLAPLAPFSFAATAVGFAIVSSDRCAGTENLFPDYLHFRCLLVMRKRAGLSVEQNVSFALQDQFHLRLSGDRSRYPCGFAAHLARPAHSILPFAFLLLNLKPDALKSVFAL